MPLSRRCLLGALALGVGAAGAAPNPRPQDIVAAARAQIGVTLVYDGGYRRLAYPGGDVDAGVGVCSDVVVRALRHSHGLDLQRLVHTDMSAHFSAYPQRWGLKRPDPHIDHRRVPNLQTYFKRQGWSLPLSSDGRDFKPGDLVTCLIPPHLPHIMVVSDRKSANGRPWVIHNIGRGVREEDRLFEFRLTGHYRLP